MTCFGTMRAMLLIALWDATLILFVIQQAAGTCRLYQERVPPQNNSDVWSFVLILWNVLNRIDLHGSAS